MSGAGTKFLLDNTVEQPHSKAGVMSSTRRSTEEQEELKIFERAAEYMRNANNLRLNNEQKLQIYGYYKQAKEGRCTTAKPGFFDFTGRAKWEAWHSLGTMSKEEAMKQYLKTVSVISPNWETTSLQQEGKRTEEEDEEGGERKRGGVGPVVSRFADQEEELAEEEKTIFDWCKEGREDKLQSLVTPHNINTKDNEGMALIHWACDRGHLSVVQLLINRGANVDIQDADQQTPLHYASSCDQIEVITYLLSHGADPSIKDIDDLTPVQVTGDATTKKLFQTSTS